MTWFFIVLTILFSLFKILATCLPTGTVNWILSKFQLHTKINGTNVAVSYGGRNLEGDEKIQIIDLFNEAVFMKKHYIWPGTEQLYLNPENKGIPLMIDTKMGKNDVKLYAFINNRNIDVVKQYKKKVVAYSLLSENLHKYLNTL